MFSEVTNQDLAQVLKDSGDPLAEGVARILEYISEEDKEQEEAEMHQIGLNDWVLSYSIEGEIKEKIFHAENLTEAEERAEAWVNSSFSLDVDVQIVHVQRRES